MIEEFKDQKEVQMIVFKLGNEEYAVPITSVQEIIMPQTPTKIPKSPHFVEGVINLRGHIIPILDGRKKFHMEVKMENTNETRIMILDVNQEIIGLVVDAVSEVIHLQTDDIEPPPVDIGEESDFLLGVGKFQNRLLILLNLKNFLDIDEASSIKSLTKVVESINQVKEVQLEKVKEKTEPKDVK
ncbi:MAG: purine-binding chemotaxis protein CheW [uncultured bacterium]|nr:MAG: purine-binding chemotaxis protein CheW [uncultured bacterium]HBH19102.1 chemotaxis protein CheW [Cyanobacteria bacterium UBA9579]